MNEKMSMKSLNVEISPNVLCEYGKNKILWYSCPFQSTMVFYFAYI